MKRLLFLVFVLLVGAAWAETEDEKGLIVNFLEERLSSEGSKVTIEGFRGALSSDVEIDRLTIADGEGPWLVLEGAVLKWKRAALLEGRIDIEELSAARLMVARPPTRGDTASGEFALPDIPLSIEIDDLAIGRAEIGAELIGQDAVLALTGNASLVAGSADVALEIERIDGKAGIIAFAGHYSSEDRILALDLEVSEAAEGILAGMLDLPGWPALDFTLKSNDPIDDFTAEIRLATDQQERLSGSFRTVKSSDGSRSIAVDIAGDIAPLFAPEYQSFFGNEIVLKAAGVRAPGGGIEVSRVHFGAQSLSLDGSLALAAGHLPLHFELQGRIADAKGEPVLLPLQGPETRVGAMELAVAFDASEGEAWTAVFDIIDLEREGVTTTHLRLDGQGTIGRDRRNAMGQSGFRGGDGSFDFTSEGLRLDDAAWAAALGQGPSGRFDFSWIDGDPIAINALTLKAGGAAVLATGRIDPYGNGPAIDMQVTAAIDSLSPYSGLVRRSLGGRLDASLALQGGLADSPLMIDLAATGQNLSVQQAQIDRALVGQSLFALKAVRTAERLEVKSASLDTEALNLSADALLSPGQEQVKLSAAVPEVSRIDSRLEGPLVADIAIESMDEAWHYLAQVQGLAGEAINLMSEGKVTASEKGYILDGTSQASVADLSVLSAIVGQGVRLGGQVRAEATNRVSVDPSSPEGFDMALTAKLEGQDMRSGILIADRLVQGSSQIDLDIEKAGRQIEISRLEIASPVFRASAEGQVDGEIDFEAHLEDIGIYTPDYSGAVAVRGQAERVARGWQVVVDGTGPAGIAAEVTGLLPSAGFEADLRLRGQAPLDIANVQLSPRAIHGTARYDLNLQGPLALGSLTGIIAIEDSRFIEPALDITLEKLGGEITLGVGRAELDLAASLATGGDLRVQGPIELRPPFAAALQLSLANGRLIDPKLYEVEVAATLNLKGPLAGGAQITGEINIGESEIRVPAGGMGSGGDIPEITHIAEPSAVHETRERAGLIAPPRRESSQVLALPYPLDVIIDAPGRIFVRGRGLDAELGGRLHISGSSAAPSVAGGLSLLRGRLDILGKRLELSEGSLSLQGGLDPYIHLVAETKANDVTILVTVQGLASTPEIHFSSIPELPEDEVLAHLLFERDLSALSVFQAAQMVNALRVLTGKSDGGLINDLRERLGVDDLDISTDEAGNVAARAGKYLSENIYTDVEIGAEKSSINLNIDLSEDLTGRGSVSSDGESTIGVFFEHDY